VVPENIRNVHVSLCFNYSLSKVYKTDFKTLASVDVSSASGISSVDAFGTLQLEQLVPLYSSGYKKTDYNENPLREIVNQTLPNLLIEY